MIGDKILLDFNSVVGTPGFGFIKCLKTDGKTSIVP